MKIAIDARLNAHAGGVFTVLTGLLHALGQLEDGDEEYVIIAHADAPHIWDAVLGPNQRVVVAPRHERLVQMRRLRWLNPLASVLRYTLRRLVDAPYVPESRGYFESLGCDIVHFTSQEYLVCALPSIYMPFDLQHLHYPEYFSARTIIRRETMFQAGCRYAQAIVLASEWVKQDFVEKYGLHPSRLQVIQLPPPIIEATVSESDTASILDRYAIHEPFILYPAATWPHKNHLRLLDAFARIQAKTDLMLICTGSHKPHYAAIHRHIDALGLWSRVRFPGLIPSADLNALYRACEFVIFPTLFEGAGMPPLEAWYHGRAVACSAVASLPEAVGDAALTFDPYDVNAIAEAILSLDQQPDRRAEFAARGKKRLQLFDWERTARTFRALYRQLGRQTLSEDDRTLLNNI
jgi:glycosyltransferase involved in cell wall biosynthesis